MCFAPLCLGTTSVGVVGCTAGTVKRVVVTSSVGAVVAPLTVPSDHVYSEADWNTESTAEQGAYYLRCETPCASPVRCGMWVGL